MDFKSLERGGLAPLPYLSFNEFLGAFLLLRVHFLNAFSEKSFTFLHVAISRNTFRTIAQGTKGSLLVVDGSSIAIFKAGYRPIGAIL